MSQHHERRDGEEAEGGENVAGDQVYPDENTPLVSNRAADDLEAGGFQVMPVVQTLNNKLTNSLHYAQTVSTRCKVLCSPRESSTATQAIGIGFVVLAGILFTFSNVIQKKLVRVDQWHLLFFRALLQIASMGVAVLVK